MIPFRIAILSLGLVAAATGPARSDDAADARAIIEKAVKAQGGQEKLEKFTARVIKFKGNFHGMGQAIPMAGEVSTQGNNRVRADVEVEAGGMKLRIVNVVAGEKGWTRLGDNVMELDKDQLKEGHEQAFGGWVATLAPVKDKQFTLSTIGEIEIDKKAALGVKVKSKGHRDVDLYFDKKTGLLVKSETMVKDEGSGQEVIEESFASDYKDVQGTKQAMKFTVKRDGKLFLEGEASEVVLSEKLDPSVFDKP